MKTIVYLLCIALLSVFAHPSFAQADSLPSTDLKLLLELEGYWEAAATMQTGGKEYRFPYYADFRKTAANSGLVMQEWCNIPGLGKLNGTNLIGIDPYDGKVHWYTVDNQGTTHEHRGAFKDREHFGMIHKGNREGKAYEEAVQFVREGKDKLAFKLVAKLDDQEIQVITGTFQRKPRKASTDELR
jgi:hypothetical protein